ncbi:HAD family hydrolase [Williamsia sterculiae]|uniref:Cof subfamily of IIB subfamily of haloacid dehalogenase superfamily/HAD-superfamily hydrolase, subfamily IIB n=1 Tax=Williamsia sterculiae TaxID=1344003 RepID=A0A1N7F6P6_9NOCA|nr:HAD hydrolase family protein [Williamsia sterculiae]SIR95990.1 hypothetical protein SAMN05445060_1870 [Williamsia sterculiae]
MTTVADPPVLLVATDLDGTLLDADRAISPRTAAALASAADHGIEVVWATARARHSVRELAASCGFRGTAISANGAVLIDLADGDARIVEVYGIEAEVRAAAIAAVTERLPGTSFAIVGPTRFRAEPGYRDRCVFVDHHRDPAGMDTIASAADAEDPGEPVVKIVARHPDLASEELFTAMAATPPNGVTVTHSGAPYVEMAAAGVSKAAALQRCAAMRGIARDQVAAIGDASNDLAMLTWAGVAVCPQNAYPEVAAVADVMIGAHDDDGVARYLESLVGRS